MPDIATIAFDVTPLVDTAQGNQEPPQLGRDLLFTDDLQVGAHGDYQTVEGDDNLRAAIWRRLSVNPGEYKLRPTYGAGVPSYVKKPASKANLDECELKIREQLAQERRIQRVADVSISPQVINGQTAWVIGVAVVSGGKTQRFSPFTFTEQG